MLSRWHACLRPCVKGTLQPLLRPAVGSRSSLSTSAAYPYSDSLALYQGLQTLPLPRLQLNAVPVVHHPLYSAPQLRPGHRFPMQIFQTIHDTLISDNVIDARQVLQPPCLPSLDMTLLAHDREYATNFLACALPDAIKRRIGLQDALDDPVLVQRTMAEVSGVLMSAELALAHGAAVNTAGGTHHAFRDTGSGFCIINDFAITAEVLLARGDVQRVLILDLDVHQGDGTASIFEGRQDVFTCSFHAANNFPTRKQKSTLDVPLPDGMQDDAYCRLLAETLPDILMEFKPDICLYDAGVDPHAEDDLGRLNLSDDGLFRRDMMVFEACMARGIPIAGNVGGGYSRDLKKLARWHCLMHRAASQCWTDFRL